MMNAYKKYKKRWMIWNTGYEPTWSKENKFNCHIDSLTLSEFICILEEWSEEEVQ